MGRLSAYAKNRILNLRFQKHNKITQIVKALTDEDIKISRQSVSTFLKRYLATDSISDKPRSGRKRKLTSEEIELIGEITRLNRDITARSIKEHLNLNVSTYTILRATKLFEWNKFNPNSNEAKRQAAIEKQSKGEKRRKYYPKKLKKEYEITSMNLTTQQILNEQNGEMIQQTECASTSEIELPSCLQLINVNQLSTGSDLVQLKNDDELYNLKLINEREIQSLKNTACSAMSFATKILFKIYSIDELHGHNVSGKTFNKNIGHKEPLEEKRLMYIKWLIEKNFADENCNREQLWKACCNSINKMIRRSELNAIKQDKHHHHHHHHHQTQQQIDEHLNLAQDNMILINGHNGVDMNSNNENHSIHIIRIDNNLEDSLNYDECQDDDFIEIEKQQPRKQFEQHNQRLKEQHELLMQNENDDDNYITELVPSKTIVQTENNRCNNDDIASLSSSSSSSSSPTSSSASSNKKNFVVIAAAHQPKRLENKELF